jgi:DNA-binding MarR family transcriptional regulator
MAQARARPSPSKGKSGQHCELREPCMRVLRDFRLIFNSVKRHFQQVERVAGIGGAQLWALSTIRDNPGIGVTELARTMEIHQSTASNLVRTLLERDLVSILKDGADRRAVKLRLRPPGTAMLRRAPGPFTGVLPDALAQLEDATLLRMQRDLGKLIAILHPNERAAGTPLADMMDGSSPRKRSGAQRSPRDGWARKPTSTRRARPV